MVRVLVLLVIVTFRLSTSSRFYLVSLANSSSDNFNSSTTVGNRGRRQEATSYEDEGGGGLLNYEDDEDSDYQNYDHDDSHHHEEDVESYYDEDDDSYYKEEDEAVDQTCEKSSDCGRNARCRTSTVLCVCRREAYGEFPYCYSIRHPLLKIYFQET